MGKSSGGSSTTQKSKPYLATQIKQAAGYATDLYNQGAPEYYAGNTVAAPSAETQQALTAMAAQANGGMGNGLNGAAADQALATIRGDYLNSNTYLDQVIASSSRDVTDNFLNSVLPMIQSNFAQSGRYGSGIQDQAVGTAVGQTSQSIADAAANLRYQNYAGERQNQLATVNNAGAINQNTYQDAQMLSGVGSARDALEQARIDADIQRYEYGQNADQTALNNYIQQIVQLNGGYGTTTNKSAKSSNGILSTLGGLTSIGGLGLQAYGAGLFGGGAFNPSKYIGGSDIGVLS